MSINLWPCLATHQMQLWQYVLCPYCRALREWHRVLKPGGQLVAAGALLSVRSCCERMPP